MNAVALIGRIIFGGYFLVSGVNHFMRYQMMTGYAASKGVPMPGIAVLASGALILIGGAMILAGWRPHWGAWLIVLFLVPVTVMMHNFWAVPADEKMTEMANFMKNTGLIGAALMLSTIRHWPLSVEKSAPR